jgi:hypothetical protein
MYFPFIALTIYLIYLFSNTFAGFWGLRGFFNCGAYNVLACLIGFPVFVGVVHLSYVLILYSVIAIFYRFKNISYFSFEFFSKQSYRFFYIIFGISFIVTLIMTHSAAFFGWFDATNTNLSMILSRPLQPAVVLGEYVIFWAILISKEKRKRDGN